MEAFEEGMTSSKLWPLARTQFFWVARRYMALQVPDKLALSVF
jgi:hypothetical protein